MYFRLPDMISVRKKLLMFSTALLLAGCSKHPVVPSVSAQNQSPEPVDRTAPPAGAQPAMPASQPPQGMYAQPAQPAAPANPPAPPNQPPANPPAPAPPPAYDAPVVPVGTPLRVRLDESLGTRHDRTGERFYASLASPVVVDGRTLLPVGTRFIGHLTESKPSGRLKGRAVLAMRLDGLDWRGRVYPVDTSSYVRVSRNHKRHNFKWIGGGGGAGAVIGAIAGGGEGALIGAAAGAGAGTAGALVTGRKQVGLRAETPITFRLRRPLQAP